MAGWVADVPEAVLTDLYLRVGPLPAGRPSRSTIWRVCTDADPQALDTAIGAWASGRLAIGNTTPCPADGDAAADDTPRTLQVRLDGKPYAGPRTPMVTNCTCWRPWPAAPSPAPPVVLAQAEVTEAKTNEPTTGP